MYMVAYTCSGQRSTYQTPLSPTQRDLRGFRTLLLTAHYPTVRFPGDNDVPEPFCSCKGLTMLHPGSGFALAVPINSDSATVFAGSNSPPIISFRHLSEVALDLERGISTHQQWWPTLVEILEVEVESVGKARLDMPRNLCHFVPQLQTWRSQTADGEDPRSLHTLLSPCVHRPLEAT